MLESFYRSFEDKYRGSRELIKSRLQVYIPFVSLLLEKSEESHNFALDLGCGRGEWLELLTEKGFSAHGVDIDSGMLDACYQRNLSVENADAINYLQSAESESIAVISGFHVAEHMPFDKLQELVEQSLRVLKPSGLLILETPNPENIVVGTTNFYLDPTHERPIPPQLFSFVAEYSGFIRVKTLRLQEPKGLLEAENISLMDVFSGVSPDYSIIAQKNAAENILEMFDGVFAQEYGISLGAITQSYEEQMKGETDKLKNKLQEYLLKLTEKETRQQQTNIELANSQNENIGLKGALSNAQEQLLENAGIKDALSNAQEQLLEHSGIKNALNKVQEQLEERVNVLLTKESAINHLNVELEAVYASKSWRIMLHLRQIMHAFKKLFLLPVSFLRGFTLSPKVKIHNFIAKLIKYISHSPFIRSVLIRVLNNFPGIKIKLIALINANGWRFVISTQQVPGQDIEDEPIRDSIVARPTPQKKVSGGLNSEMKSPLEKWFY